ncbi:MAG: rhodanese-like domain-containing protein, partial [Pirellula sp.]
MQRSAMEVGWQYPQASIGFANRVAPYGSAKDPIHMIAFTAINDLQGHPKLLPPDAPLDGYQVVDVRTAKEQSELPLPGSVAIPIDELPDGSGKLDPTLP